MSIKYISDLHLDGGSTFQRERAHHYGSEEEWREAFVKSWNSETRDTDIVWVVGDVCRHLTPEVGEILSRLNGHLNLVRGNHDWANDSGVLYHRYFEAVVDYTELADCGPRCVLCHYPIEAWAGRYSGVIHIHGHVHGSLLAYQPNTPNRYNVWAPALGDCPRSLQWLMDRYGYDEHAYDDLWERVHSAPVGV